MALTKKRALWGSLESTYTTDPSASGSTYKYIPAIEIGDLADNLEQLDTNYMTARPWSTAPIAGRDGWSFSCVVPLIGLAAAAGDGVSPGADDWLDDLLEHLFGTQSDLAGEGLGAGSTASTLVLDTDVYGVQQVVPVYEAGLAVTGGARTQWHEIVADAGTGSYTIDRAWTTAAGTAGVAYGTKSFYFNDLGGNSMAFVYRQDDVDYTLLGGRCTSATLSTEGPGQIWKLSLEFSGDQKVQEAKGSLPAVAVLATTPLKSLLSPVFWADAAVTTRAISIELGIGAGEVGSTAAVNGRQNWQNRSKAPRIKIEPQFSNALLVNKRAATQGQLLVQLGAGVLSGGVLNTMCLSVQQAVMMEAGPKDDAGDQRQAITFRVDDPVTFSGAAARVLQLVRA